MLIIITGCESAALPTLIPTSTQLPTDTPVPTAAPPTATPGIMPRTTTRNPDEQAYYRVIHAAPEEETVDLYIEMLGAAMSLEYGQITSLGGIVAGEYMIHVMPAGERPDTGAAIIRTPVKINGGQSLILMFTGTADARSLAIYEDFTLPLRKAQSGVRVIHAIPRGPDFHVEQANTTISEIVGFGQLTDNLILPPGQTELVFRSSETILTRHPINLRERYNYTLFVIGSPDDLNSISVLAIDSQADGLTQIQTINASESIGLVDIYAGDTLIGESVDYGELSVSKEIISSNYLISVYEAGADIGEIQPIVSRQMLANPDDRTTLILVGEASTLNLITYKADTNPTPPGQSRVTFLNTLSNVPRLRLETDGGFSQDMIYGQISTPVMFTAKPINFYWVDTSTENILETAADFVLTEGVSTLYLFTAASFNTPLTYRQEVGIDVQASTLAVDAVSSPTPKLPTRLRVVNAMEGTPFSDFYFDEIQLQELVNYGESSPLLIIPDGTHTITVRHIEAASQSDELLSSLEREFEEDTNYSVIAFGGTVLGYDVVAIPDFQLAMDRSTTSLRLINLSQGGDTLLGLGYSGSTTNIVQPDASNNYRVPMQVNVDTLIRDVNSIDFSRPVIVAPGKYNLNILDTRNVAIGWTLTEVTLEAGRHYDVIAFQDTVTGQVDGIVVPYPSEQ